MYITTFYSFKGGVGRTMALVNAAVELANTGRRVLVVDFDLEAPGLDTFDLLRSETQVPGIIDFVGEYLDSGQAPEVDRFVNRAPSIGKGGGGLWLMPSGAQDETYAANFSQIDWNVLYGKHEGYLLFEDLKEQWNQAVKPDYVLIDSRTGHTDIGGICTRQLPNAVVIFFFPNDQNLRGLIKVVGDIRTETTGPRKKEIELHFVMSNVPDLDDEDRILESKMNAFQDRLRFKRELMVIHRYDSMSLLNQVVFTRDRSRSRLAKEYRDFVQNLIRRNPADREGALNYIRRVSRPRYGYRRGGNYESPQKIDSKLQQIEEAHLGDGEVLFNLGVLREDYRQSEQAALLFDRAIDAGYNEPDAYLKRARLRAENDDSDGAAEDASKALRSDGLPPHLVREAMLLAMRSHSRNIADSKAVLSLDYHERIWLADTLLADTLYGTREKKEAVVSSKVRSDRLHEAREKIRIAVSILQPLIDTKTLPDEDRRSAISQLALAQIGIGEFTQAMKLLSDRRRGVNDMNIQDAFNYGMAVWGDTGTVVPDPFFQVIRLSEADSNPPEKIPNYLQCMAIAYWATGNKERAVQFIHKARTAIDRARRPEFSCWQYREVEEQAFKEDLDSIHAMIEGDTSRTPRFIQPAA